MNLKTGLLSLVGVFFLASCGCNNNSKKTEVNEADFDNATKDAESKHGCYKKVTSDVHIKVVSEEGTKEENKPVQLDFKSWETPESVKFPVYEETVKTGDAFFDGMIVPLFGAIGDIYGMKISIKEYKEVLTGIKYFKNPYTISIDNATMKGVIDFDDHYIISNYDILVVGDEANAEVTYHYTGKIHGENFITPSSQN
mgnify:CR=1 FL=1